MKTSRKRFKAENKKNLFLNAVGKIAHDRKGQIWGYTKIAIYPGYYMSLLLKIINGTAPGRIASETGINLPSIVCACAILWWSEKGLFGRLPIGTNGHQRSKRSC